LNPNDPRLYLHRSQLYLAIGDQNRAAKDHSKAEKLAGKAIPGFQSGDHTSARKKTEKTEQSDPEIAIISQASDPGSNDIELLEKRGWDHFFNADYEAALSDFRAIAKIKPDDIYSQLWLFITSGHGGASPFDTVTHDFSPDRLQQWPGVLLQFYLGNKSESQVVENYADDPIQSRLEKTCEASYYIGEYYLINGQVDRALAYFRKAVATGLSEFLAFRNSKSHIDKLGDAN